MKSQSESRRQRSTSAVRAGIACDTHHGAVIPPIHLLDVAGLDIYTSVASYLNQDLSDEKGVSSTAQKLHDEGRLGIKAGGGFFNYTPEQAQQLQQERAGKLVAVRKALS